MKSNLQNLANLSYKNGQLDQETVDLVASKLNRQELKQYIKLLKQEETKKQVFVTSAQPLDKKSQEKIQKLFPDKKINYAVDPSIISGIKIVENDVEYEINLNQIFDNLVAFLSKTD